MADDYTTVLWTGRFKRYPDADLLAWWRRAPEEPDAIDEMCLAEIARRALDF